MEHLTLNKDDVNNDTWPQPILSEGTSPYLAIWMIDWGAEASIHMFRCQYMGAAGGPLVPSARQWRGEVAGVSP